MKNSLWQARLQAFVIQAGSLIVIAIAGVFLSEDFKGLVTQHFGDTFLTSSALLFLTGFVSHIRNKWVLGKLGGVGSEPEGKTDTIVLI